MSLFHFKIDTPKPESFKAAERICETRDKHEGSVTAEFIAETFYCLGALEGITMGKNNPAESELFIAQLKKAHEEYNNGRESDKDSW